MHSSLSSILSLLATLAIPTLAQNGPYFVLGSGMPVSIQRLDPILSAGKVAGHVHSIVGGNAFAATMDFASTQKASCSTIRVIADKSNYWMPALYFHNPSINGSYIRVPEKPDHRIYYKFGKGDNTPDLERSEFPEGFRMISGSANLRHDDGSMGVGGNQLNWVCHDGGSNPKATGFPKGFRNCDNYGFAASMRFPSCWSGRDFDPAHPLAHMDFPTNQDGLAGCREGFRVKRFAEIFVEYYLNTKSFNGLYGPNDLPWVLAQGDPTGYGFHMDFLNGWAPGVLAKAMKTCNIGNTGDPLDSTQCFGAGSLRSPSEADNCRVPPSLNEDVGLRDLTATDNSDTRGGVLAALPGCNPIQAGPGDATQQSGCGATTQLNGSPSPAPVIRAASPSSSTSSSTKPSPTTPSSSPASGAPKSLTPGWTYSGCFTDTIVPRSLGSGRFEYWGKPITSSDCISQCDSQGKKIAGTENGGQCFCGDVLVGSKPANADACGIPCEGDKDEICGGRAVMSVFKKKTGSKKMMRARGGNVIGRERFVGT